RADGASPTWRVLSPAYARSWWRKTSTTPRSRARRRTPTASGEASISGKRARTWRRTAALLEKPGERLDHNAAGAAVDHAHDVGDDRDEVLAAVAAHHPHVVEPRREGPRDGTARCATRRLDAKAHDLVVVELVLRRGRQVGGPHQDARAHQRLGRAAVLDAREREQHEAAAMRGCRPDLRLAARARAREQDAAAGDEARRGRLVGVDAHPAPQGVRTDDLAHGDQPVARRRCRLTALRPSR